MVSLEPLINKIEQFTNLVKTKASTRVVTEADNANTLAGLTPTEVSASVTKSDVGLGNVPNYGIPTLTEALDQGVVDKLVRPFDFNHYMDHYLNGGSLGEVMVGLDNKYVATPLLKRLSIVANDTERTEAENSEESFSDVFNYWYRFSHSGATQPANVSELSAWQYDAVQDRILSTINSATYVGFVGPDKFSDYTFEVEVSSTSADDDFIGLVAAFTTENGQECVLAFFRVLMFTDYTFFAVYNPGQSDQVILSTSLLGASSNPRMNSSGGSGWSGSKAKIKLTRTGDVFTAVTTELDSNAYLNNYALTVDLNSETFLEKFKGPSRTGYICFSQPNSTWKTLQRPGSRLPIVDIRDYSTHLWDGSQWVQQPADAYVNLLIPNKFYFNGINGKLYFYQSDKTIYQIGQRGS
jgi:hypothetical protein